MEIRNRTFLVSGGSSGLGAACVRMLADGGGNVVIADVNREQGEQLVAELGTRVRFAVADVTDAGSVQNAVHTALTAFGGLHGAIACAGVGLAETIVEGPHRLESFLHVISVNLTGTFNVLRLAAAAMARGVPGGSGERGVIVTTASVAAFVGQMGQAAYAASKGGVVAMTLSVALELARHGIRIVSIAPGLFETPFLAGLPESVRQSFAQQTPFPRRLGRPDEFASLVRHIIENQMLNGEVICLDGAIRTAVLQRHWEDVPPET